MGSAAAGLAAAGSLDGLGVVGGGELGAGLVVLGTGLVVVAVGDGDRVG